MTGPDSCDAPADLVAWVTGDLPRAEAARAGAHLRRCPECRREAAALRGMLEKLPGDDAPAVEPPPALKERIMSVVRAEARAFGSAADAPELPATVSLAAAPAGRATLTVGPDGAVLRAECLPAPPDGAAYRVWFMGGPGGRHDGPRVPSPGPRIEVAGDGRGRWDLGVLDGVGEVAVALEGDTPGAGGRPVLRVRLP